MAKKTQRIRSNTVQKARPKPGARVKGKGKIQAKPKEVDGIKFKSMLEVFCYRKLKELGVAFTYEEHSYQLTEAFYYPCPIFETKATTKEFADKSKDKIRGISYTPDFVSHDADGKLLWVIECKGFANDRFPNTWKNFKKHLMDNDSVCPLFLPKDQKQILQVIQLISEL
jgi:hypothetical protein